MESASDYLRRSLTSIVIVSSVIKAFVISS